MNDEFPPSTLSTSDQAMLRTVLLAAAVASASAFAPMGGLVRPKARTGAHCLLFRTLHGGCCSILALPPCWGELASRREAGGADRGGLLVAMQHRADHFETAGVKLQCWRGFQKSGCDGWLTCVCLGVAVCAQPL